MTTRPSRSGGSATFAAAFAAWLVLAGVALAQPVDPEIVVSPTSFSFGNVCVGTSSQKTVTITNDAPKGNGETLHVDGITRLGSSSFSFIDPSPFSLEPKESVDFGVTFNASLPPGGRAATFRISSDDPDDDPLSVPASATVVHRLIATDASTVAFGEQRVGTRSPNKPLVVRNPGQDPITITSIKRTGANGLDFVVASPALPVTIAAGDIRTITIAFQPTGEGLRKGTLEITSNSCTQPKLNVGMVGTGVLPNINVQPNPINVGSSPVGAPGKPTAITVSNEGAAALKITAIQIIGTDAADFALSGQPPLPKTLQPEESFVFSIRMTATEEGLRLATINVLSDDPDGSTFGVAVRGTATAASPSASPSASASPTTTPSATATASSTPVPAGTPNDSLAIMLVVAGVFAAFGGLIVVRRLMRSPDDEDMA